MVNRGANRSALARRSGRPPSPRTGWWVVGALFLMLTVNAGFGFYALGSYAENLERVRGLSLTATSIGSTIFMLASGLGGIFTARAVARLRVGTVVLISCTGNAAMLAVLGLAAHQISLWVVYFVFGVASAGNSVICASALIMEWFGDSPARAIAIATTGMSVGGALVAPSVEALVSSIGLSAAGSIEAGISLVVIVPLALTILRRDPPVSEQHRVADGELAEDVAVLAGDPAAADQHLPQGGGWRFAAVCVIFMLMFMSQVGTVTHLLLLAAERSIPHAATALTVLAGTSVVARLSAIPVLPRIGVARFTVATAGVQAVAMVILAVAHDRGVLYLAAFFLGFSVANAIVLLPLWVLEVCGRNNYAVRYARANLATSVGTGFAPAVTGVLHTALGGYTGPFLVLAIGSAVAAAVSTVLGLSRRGSGPGTSLPLTSGGLPAPGTS